MVINCDGDSPFAAFTAFTIGKINPRRAAPIKPNIPKPKSRMAGILMIIYRIRLI
jgi:hypothetical protein